MNKVYFIQCGNDGPIKIGYTKNINTRLSNLQLSNPYLLTVLCTVDGGEHEEKSFHKQFKKYHIIGEWFNPGDELLSFISTQPHLGLISERGLELEMNPCWKGAKATDNTKRQRVVRRFELKDCEICGKPGTDRHHKDNNLDNFKPENIVVVCRRCCMKLDGRLEKFREQALKTGDRLRKPPTKCKICGELKKHQSHGRCHTCSEYFRRKGIERPIK